MDTRKFHKRRTRRKLVPLEPLFLAVKEALVHDLGYGFKHVPSSKCTSRGEKPLINIGAPPYAFKRFQQIWDFDKRIIWSSDTSFESLAFEGLYDFPVRQLDYLLPEPMSLRATLVLQEARVLCHQILGDFSWDEWLDSCSYGKRAAVDLPRAISYLDTRFKRISGTEKQWAVFNGALSRDVHLLRAVRKLCRKKKIVAHTEAAAVPKSWKVARIIAKNTILGGFLSRGLGSVVRKRLEANTSIDLSLQQMRHKKWARQSSKTGESGTIDLKKASDSWTRRHLEVMLPSDWLHPLEVVHTDVCKIGDDHFNLRSYMLMGEGHTFPLQTLLFYCLAKATCNLLKERGLVSVYGDDIIIPIKACNPFISIMTDLGFVINKDKSFYDAKDPERPSHTFFRESCGGDYKGGVDVRPHMPECDLQSDAEVPVNEYIGWCHKLINGLLDHWDNCELNVTLSYLLNEICRHKNKIVFVPSWEVDHAGIRHLIPERLLVGLDVSYIKYRHSLPEYFKLVYKIRKRERSEQERPYYWYKLWITHESVPDPLYDEAISLDGEPLKSKGDYRWEHFGSYKGVSCPYRARRVSTKPVVVKTKAAS